jgi:hypothetical protein
LFELQEDLAQLFNSPLMEVVPKVSVATPGCGVALSRLSTWGRFGYFLVKLTEFLLQFADLILQVKQNTVIQLLEFPIRRHNSVCFRAFLQLTEFVR